MNRKEIKYIVDNGQNQFYCEDKDSLFATLDFGKREQWQFTQTYRPNAVKCEECGGVGHSMHTSEESCFVF